MNPDPVYQRLREIGWRRPLSEAEQAELRTWLHSHPEQLAEAEAEAMLTRALAKLPEAPVPSNFTARVLQAIDREEQAASLPARRWSVSGWRLWLPRLAVAVVVVTIGSVAYWHKRNAQQTELTAAARKLATVAGTSALSDPVVLEDFDVICQMSQADESLLALSDDLLSLQQ